MKIKPMLHMCINKAIKYKEQVPVSGAHRPQWPVYGEYTYIPAQNVFEKICMTLGFKPEISCILTTSLTTAL